MKPPSTRVLRQSDFEPVILGLAVRRGLESSFNRELNLPLRNRGAYQDTSGTARIGGRRCQGCSGCVKDIGVTVSRTRRRKVWMVQNVEHFQAELDVEVFRNALD